jgi:MFS family permease
MVGETTGQPPQRSRRFGGLLRERNFRLLATGETVSAVGSAVTTVVMPLIAVTTLRASAFWVGVLAAAVWLPWLPIGLVAGVWVDRLPRKPVMLVCDLGSLIVLASVPVAAWFGVLTLAHLIAAALLAGVCSVFFSLAYRAYLPVLVIDDAALIGANSALQAGSEAATIAGPGIGGLLTQLLGAATGLLADAVSFAVSAICLLAIRADEPRRARTGSSRVTTEIVAGMRFAFADRHLRPLMVFGGTINLAFGALEAVQVVFLVRTLGVNPATVGSLMALAAVGGVLGALLAARIAARIGSARTLVWGVLVTMPFTLLVPLASPGAGLILFVAGLLVASLGVAVFNVLVNTFVVQYAPMDMLARIGATTSTVAFASLPVGSLAGGALAGAWGARQAIAIAAITMIASALLLVFSALRRLRDLPTRVASVGA